MSDGGDLEHAECIIHGIIKKYVGVGELALTIAAAEKRGRLAGLKEARSRARAMLVELERRAARALASVVAAVRARSKGKG